MTWHFSFSGRRAVRRSVVVAAVAAILVLGGCSSEAQRPAPGTEPGRDGFAVLVFTRTTGFRHASIDDGVAAIRRLGTANGFTVDVTQDPERIQDATLKGYRVVVFLSSTGEPLDPTQQAALERWVEAGGGWVGVHAAADAFYDWPWYGELVGAWFRRHPSVQRATVHVTIEAIRPLGRSRRRGLAPMSGTTFVTIREGACRCLQWSMSRATRVVAWGPIIRSSGVISRAGAVRGTRHLAIPRRAGPNRCSSLTSLAESAGRQVATSVTSPPRAPGRCHKRSRILLAGAITCVGPGSSPMDDRSLR